MPERAPDACAALINGPGGQTICRLEDQSGAQLLFKGRGSRIPNDPEVSTSLRRPGAFHDATQKRESSADLAPVRAGSHHMLYRARELAGPDTR